MSELPIAKRLSSLFALVSLAAIVVACLLYMSSSYKRLVVWYFSLNDCFYHSSTWTTDFFTAQVKSAGNLFCLIALAVCVILARILLGTFRSATTAPPSFNRTDRVTLGKITVVDWAIIAGLWAAAIGLWFWGTSLAWPSNDEVFSAVNCAGLHPFQTLSYYMLPNNHVLFNLINNLFFHTVSDQVVSGRAISLACYLAVVTLLYLWLQSIWSHRWLVVVVVLTMSLQFPAWGFGTQARGYELLLLAAWGAFVSIIRYHTGGGRVWLRILAIACIVGYATMPTFLYYHLAIVMFCITMQWHNRRFDWALWRSQAIAMGLVYLAYLPSLCFSGVHALAGNQYIAGSNTLAQIAPDVLPDIHNYLDYTFGNFTGHNNAVDAVLFFLPFGLLFFRKDTLAMLIFRMYILMWLSIIVLVLTMKVIPIDRSVGAQYSITLMACLFALHRLVGACFTGRLQVWFALPVVVTLMCAGLAVNFTLKDRDYITHYQCHFMVNGWHDLLLNEGVRKLPQGSSVAFSGESFYLYYLCNQHGFRAVKCRTGTEDYFINLSEPFPPGLAEHYTGFSRVADYYIYKRK